MEKTQTCEHTTKLTGACVKCGSYPYDESPLMNKTDTVAGETLPETHPFRECPECSHRHNQHSDKCKARTVAGKMTGRTFHKIKGYPDFTIAFDYDDDLFHIFNNDQEIATCDTASEAKRIVKTA